MALKKPKKKEKKEDSPEIDFEHLARVRAEIQKQIARKDAEWDEFCKNSPMFHDLPRSKPKTQEELIEEEKAKWPIFDTPHLNECNPYYPRELLENPAKRTAVANDALKKQLRIPSKKGRDGGPREEGKGKRVQRVESSDEEEGRSALGKAKKRKLNADASVTGDTEKPNEKPASSKPFDFSSLDLQLSGASEAAMKLTAEFSTGHDAMRRLSNRPNAPKAASQQVEEDKPVLDVPEPQIEDLEQIEDLSEEATMEVESDIPPPTKAESAEEPAKQSTSTLTDEEKRRKKQKAKERRKLKRKQEREEARKRKEAGGGDAKDGGYEGDESD